MSNRPNCGICGEHATNCSCRYNRTPLNSQLPQLPSSQKPLMTQYRSLHDIINDELKQWEEQLKEKELQLKLWEQQLKEKEQLLQSSNKQTSSAIGDDGLSSVESSMNKNGGATAATDTV
jgi:hypothetical protein